MKNENLEVSVVMPCLNEEETLGTCIEKTQRTLDALGIQGEVIIADNGSTDNSVAIADDLGARCASTDTRLRCSLSCWFRCCTRSINHHGRLR